MDYLEKVAQKEEELASLFTRMDADRDLLYLKRYVLSDSKDRAVPDIVNVTLNKPAVFAANVISALSATSEQVVVESDNRGLDTYKIEEFQKAALNSANLRLQKRGLPSLNPHADIQLCFRGRAARRVLFRRESDRIIPDIMSWDTRFLTYEIAEEGLAWVAYKTVRSKDAIETEYLIPIAGKTGVVLDVWDKEHNEVWIDNVKVKEQPHGYGFTPVVLAVVPLGYGDILLDSDRLQHEGESIFFLCRQIIPELNRLVSILQTLNMKAVKPPMKYRSKVGATAVPPAYEDATDMGTITSVDETGDIARIDYGDAQRAAQMAYNMMESAMQEGSLTSIDLGNLQFPLSAIAITEIGEGRDRVFLPRLQAKAQLNQQTMEMVTQQVIQLGNPIELGTPGHQQTFDTAKLEGQYETTYKYFVKSPKIDIGRMAVAQQAEKWFDIEHILESILQVEDPEEILRKRYYYLAEKIDPNILRHRVIMKMLELAEDGDDDAAREAKIMAATMGMSLQQIKRGELPPPPTEVVSPSGSELPLLDEEGRIRGIPSSAKKAAELEQTPEGEE